MASYKEQARYLRFDQKTRSCLGKMVYTDKKRAAKAAQEMQGKSNKQTKIQAYKCGYCPGYHIGRSTNIKRSLEERVECSGGCGAMIRSSKLSAHLRRCKGEIDE